MGFFKFKNKNADARTEPQSTAPAHTNPVYLTQTVVFGNGDSSVYFVDETRRIRKKLVNTKGEIQHFPGVIEESFWAKEFSGKELFPRIRYRTSFEKRENKWIMLWTIQPDGDYWRDESGFGAENEDEIILYTYVDGNGDFTGPFRVYKVGEVCYSLDRFEHAHALEYGSALKALKSGKIEDQVDVLFPRLYGMNLHIGFRSVWEYYTLPDKARAQEYWSHPILSQHLFEAAEALLQFDIPILQIVGYPNDKMIHGCMTLFYSASQESVFKDVIDKFFEGKMEPFTQGRLSK